MAQTKKRNRRKKVRRQYHRGTHSVNKIGNFTPHDPTDPNHNNPLDDPDRDIPGGDGGNDGADDPPPVDDEGNPILQPGDPGYDPASASQVTAPTKPTVTTGTVAQAGDTAVREIEFVDSPPVETQEGAEGTFTNLLNTVQDPSDVKPDPETPSPIQVERQPEPTLASTTYNTEVPSKTLTSVVDNMGTGTVTKGTAPEAIQAATYNATQIAPEDVPTVDAAQGELSEGAIAQVDERALSERAQAARRDTTQEQAALTRQRANYEISDGSYVDKEQPQK
jgi:hypothetical protein